MQTSNVNNNENAAKKRCSGCKKDQDEQMFIDGKTVRATCFNCRSSNKMRKKQSRDPSQSASDDAASGARYPGT